MDELNRANQVEASLGYITAPALFTTDGLMMMGDGDAFDPVSSHREAYAAIWDE